MSLPVSIFKSIAFLLRTLSAMSSYSPLNQFGIKWFNLVKCKIPIVNVMTITIASKRVLISWPSMICLYWHLWCMTKDWENKRHPNIFIWAPLNLYWVNWVAYFSVTNINTSSTWVKNIGLFLRYSKSI